MTENERVYWLARYDEWHTKYQKIPESNTLARLNAADWAGESLIHQLAKQLRAADAIITKQDDELTRALEAGYTEGFNDGYAFFPDLGHGKVAGE